MGSVGRQRGSGRTVQGLKAAPEAFILVLFFRSSVFWQMDHHLALESSVVLFLSCYIVPPTLLLSTDGVWQSKRSVLYSKEIPFGLQKKDFYSGFIRGENFVSSGLIISKVISSVK